MYSVSDPGRAGVQILVEAKYFFSFPKYLKWLCGPSRLLFRDYWVFFYHGATAPSGPRPPHYR